MNRPALWLSIGIAAVALALAGWHWREAWWPERAARVAAPAAPAPAAATAASSLSAASSASGPLAAAPSSLPPVRHPIEAVDGATGAASSPAPATLESALANLLGGEFMATLVRSDDFARRVAATVDNLGREKAAARLWPLQPPAGRFTARRQAEGGEVVASDNFVRYARHLVLVEKVDLRQAVALYKRHYPQFQQAYEELGYPGRHFNDRVIEVIDLLLATPAAPEPLAVRLPAISGPIQPERPWLLYEFADPAQQALPAGQQLMLRMGPDNARRLKARLAELRRLLARP
jgi:hypothetical protein